MDGVHPDLVIGPGTEVLAGNGRILTAGGIDCHVHFICPQIVPTALGSGVTTLIGGGTGPAEGSKATTITPGDWYLARMLEAMDPLPVNVALLGKGNTVSPGVAGGAAAGRRERLQAARGLGLDPRRDRRRADRGRRARRPGGAAHRHPQRGRLRRGHPRRDRRPEHPRVPHRGGRRRARAGHHHRRRAPERAAQQHEPDPAAHREHPRRAPRHAHGLPPPGQLRARGPRLRREPDPADDDRRRGPAARPRRHLDDRLGRPGDGPGRRGRPAHLADGARDEGQARVAGRRRGRGQPAGPPVRRQVHDLPRGGARHRRRGRLGRARQARRPGAVGPGAVRRPPARRPQGRDDRLGADGRRQRLHPDAAAGAAAADVRRLRQGAGADLGALRRPGGDRGGAGRPAGRRPAAGRRHRHHAG